MDSFNLKQFLVENKLTGNSKLNEARLNPKLNIRQIKTELTKRIQKISTTDKYISIGPYSIDVLTYFNGGADLYMVFLTDGEDIDEASEPEFESTNPSEVAQWLIDTAESTDPGKISQWIHLAENSKLNEVRIVPKTHNFEKIATDLINQYQPDWEPGDENLSITNEIPISEVNPRFVKYLKSLPSESPNFSGTAFFEILYNGHKYGVQFYILYDEDVVVFEI
jgi:hypothetical protein